MRVQAWAPGRVNLIGDHTDHTGGLVLPMAIELGTTIAGLQGGEEVTLGSASIPERAVVPLAVTNPAAVTPDWARYVAGVVAELRPSAGFEGTVITTLPIGAGLSSSAALEVAVALALGFEGTPLELAQLCQRAEQRATGVPCGIMDQLTSAAGVEGHALRIDCTSLTIEPVPMPEDLDVVVFDSGERRALAEGAYAERAAQCQAAEAEIGPLRRASLTHVQSISDPVIRRRAHHVVTENLRVDELAAALRSGDRMLLREAMAASHASLRDDFEVSTPALDDLVDTLLATDGVIGARLTGAGFGGCVVALVEPRARLAIAARSWLVRPSGGARTIPAAPDR